jgi:hypothetical protein
MFMLSNRTVAIFSLYRATDMLRGCHLQAAQQAACVNKQRTWFGTFAPLVSFIDVFY